MPQLLYQRNDESGYEVGFWATRLNEGLEFAVRWELGGYRADGSRGEVTILVDNEQVGHSRCCLADDWNLVEGFELAFGRVEPGKDEFGIRSTGAPQRVLDYYLDFQDHHPFKRSEMFWNDCRTQFLAEVCGVYDGEPNVSMSPTGRLSRSSPNLQNIPIKSELGREIAEKFYPRKTYIPATWKPTAKDYREIDEYYGKGGNEVLVDIDRAGYRAVGWAEPGEKDCIRWWRCGYGAHPWEMGQTWPERRLKVVKK